MNNTIVKNLLPHIGAYLVMLALAFIYFSPAAFEGKVLNQHDNVQALGMQAELLKYEKETGVMPQWTNACFSGMPAYQIQQKSTNNLTKYVWRVLLLFQSLLKPHIATLLLMSCMYFLLIVLKIDWRIALAGAIGFGLSTNHIVLTLAGHSTKLIATAFIAPVIAGAILAFRGKHFLGGGLLALFLSLQLLANHFQITYYLILLLVILGLIYLVKAIQENTLPQFFKAATVCTLAGLMALGTSTTRLWTTYEYSKETIRGKSELTQKTGNSASRTDGKEGLSKDYIFNWSYGIYETANFLIPNAVGGASSENFVQDKSSDTFKALSRLGGEEANKHLRSTGHYWGTQPGTSGPVYMGIILVFLFFVGAFLFKGPLRTWILIATVFTVLLGLGKNMMWFNSLMVDYFPMYGKFRAVTAVLGVTNFLVVLLGILGLQEFFNDKREDSEKRRALYFGGAITGGICLLILLVSSMMDYGVAGQGLPDSLATALQSDRAGLLRSDVIRSLLFTALAFGTLWFYINKKIKPIVPVIAFLLLIVADVWTVNRRFIDNDSFVIPRQLTTNIQPSAANKQILQDPDPHFRVADFSGGAPWSDALTSYHHESIGGYHAAKLMRYQELIERYLSNPGANFHIYGMLNTKYIIQGPDRAQRMPDATGNAWFVRSYQTVENGDQEMDRLGTLKPKEEAVIQKRYSSGYLDNMNLRYDSTAQIRLTKYHPDKMEYQYSASSEQLAMFSEIYYPPEKGWSVYLDGEKVTPFIKANFLLRALRLPPGQNRKLEMRFEPRSYYLGEKIVLFSSLLVLLAFFGSLFMYFKQNPISAPNYLPNVVTKKSSSPLVKRGNSKTSKSKVQKSKTKKKK